MIGTAFAVVVLLLFGVIVVAFGGWWGLVLFALAIITAISSLGE